MWLIACAALILALPFLGTRYFKAARKRMIQAGSAWDHTEKYARVLLEDRHLNPRVADTVEIVLAWSGRGLLTALCLWSTTIGFRRRGEGGFDAMNAQQRDSFIRFIMGALFYDSLRTPFVGALLRHRLYWLASTASDKRVPVSEPQAEPLVVATARLNRHHMAPCG